MQSRVNRLLLFCFSFFFFFQAEDGIRDIGVTGVQTCALPIYHLFPLDTSVYIIPAVPVEIHWWDLFSISAASLGLSYLASYYPAKRAAATLPRSEERRVGKECRSRWSPYR